MNETGNTTPKHLEPVQYTLQFIPKVISKTDEEGKQIMKAVYKRTSNPSEASMAKGIQKSKFYHLEIFKRDENNILDGDDKPYTITVFENDQKLLFENLEMLEGDEEAFDILPSKRKPKLLKTKMSGRVRKVPSPLYYATYLDKNGVKRKLMQNRRQPDGSFIEEPVIMDYVSYFLRKDECTPDGDAVARQSALKQIQQDLVSGQDTDTTQQTANAQDDAETVEETNIPTPTEETEE